MEDLEGRMRFDDGWKPAQKTTFGEIIDEVVRMALEKVNAAQNRLHLIAFGVGLAVLIINDVVLLAVAIAIIGGG